MIVRDWLDLIVVLVIGVREKDMTLGNVALVISIAHALVGQERANAVGPEKTNMRSSFSFAVFVSQMFAKLIGRGECFVVTQQTFLPRLVTHLSNVVPCFSLNL